MALSYAEHIGDGVTATFAVPFPYIDRSHVFLAVAGAPVTFFWNSPNTITAAITPEGDSVVKVFRETPRDERLADFADDSIIDEALLDLMSLQLFYIAQEAYDVSAAAITVVADGNYDARLRRVKNIGDPIEPTDAINLRTFEGNFLPQLRAEADRAQQSSLSAAETLQQTQVINASVAASYEHMRQLLAAAQVLADLTQVAKTAAGASADIAVERAQYITQLVEKARLDFAATSFTINNALSSAQGLTTEAGNTLTDIRAQNALNTAIAAAVNTDRRATEYAAGNAVTSLNLTSDLHRAVVALSQTIDSKHAAIITSIDRVEEQIPAVLEAAAGVQTLRDDAVARVTEAATTAVDTVTAHAAAVEGWAAQAEELAAHAEDMRREASTAASTATGAKAIAEVASITALEARDTALSYTRAVEAVGVGYEALQEAVARAQLAAESALSATEGALTWEGVANKPAAYPPASHMHAWDDLYDRPTVFPPANHNHAWLDISGKPATFPATVHTHSWNDLTEKPLLFDGTYAKLTGIPTTFPAAAHTHAWDTVTGKPTAFPSQWSQVSDKPSTFPPAPHSHALTEVAGLETALVGKADTTHSHGLATASAAGFMAPTDKQKVMQLAEDGTAPFAAALKASVTINTVPFDGTTSISVADASKLPLTGGTLTGALTAPTLTGALAHNNGYLTLAAYNSTYDDGSTARIWWDGTTSSLNLSRAGGTVTTAFTLNVPRLAATSDITATGGITAGSNLTANGSILHLGAATTNTRIWHSGNHSYIDNFKNGSLYFRSGSGSTVALTVTAAGAGTFVGDVTAYSDVRVKTNIQVIPHALDKVATLRGVTFDRVDVESERQTGVIAQELQKVLPEAVRVGEDGILSVAYGNLAGLLIEAIKTLKEQVDELRTALSLTKGTA